MDSTPIVLAHEPPFRIGEAQVRPPTREIVFSGHESIIEPRVMQMLVALHRADGAVVSKDDLLQACWGGRIVGEDAINRVASRLRGVAEKLQVALRHVLAQVGRFNEGLEVLDRALERYPQSPRLHVDRIESLTILGRLDEAESAIDRAYSLWPRDYSVWFRRVYYLHGNGRNAEAAAMVEDRANRPVGIPDWKFDLTGLQVKSVGSGDRAKIREALDASEESARRGVGFMENAAIFAASVGDLDMAFRMLNALYFNREFPGNDARWSTEQAMFTGRERETSILFFPQLAGLRRDPRYRALTREIGLDEYWRLSDSRPEI